MATSIRSSSCTTSDYPRDSTSLCRSNMLGYGSFRNQETALKWTLHPMICLAYREICLKNLSDSSSSHLPLIRSQPSKSGWTVSASQQNRVSTLLQPELLRRVVRGDAFAIHHEADLWRYIVTYCNWRTSWWVCWADEYVYFALLHRPSHCADHFLSVLSFKPFRIPSGKRLGGLKAKTTAIGVHQLPATTRLTNEGLLSHPGPKVNTMLQSKDVTLPLYRCAEQNTRIKTITVYIYIKRKNTCLKESYSMTPNVAVDPLNKPIASLLRRPQWRSLLDLELHLSRWKSTLDLDASGCVFGMLLERFWKKSCFFRDGFGRPKSTSHSERQQERSLAALLVLHLSHRSPFTPWCSMPHNFYMQISCSCKATHICSTTSLYWFFRTSPPLNGTKTTPIETPQVKDCYKYDTRLTITSETEWNLSQQTNSKKMTCLELNVLRCFGLIV